MCFQEFIAYACGHRSVAVIRACPLTTRSHNFPVCGIQPVRQYFADTMCALCEREIHSRWVLIREWEHRWLHDRGACSCNIEFPGASYTPKATGAMQNLQDHGGPSRKGKEKATDIPSAWKEYATADGERHVEVRITSPYGVEWRADHGQLHKAGKCQCPAQFEPAVPQIPDDKVDLASRGTLNAWRHMEERQGGHPPGFGHVQYTGQPMRAPGRGVTIQGHAYQSVPQIVVSVPPAFRSIQYTSQTSQQAPQTPEHAAQPPRDPYTTPPNKYTYPQQVCPAPQNTPEAPEQAAESSQHACQESEHAYEASQRAYHAAQQAFRDYRQAWRVSQQAYLMSRQDSQASQASQPPQYTEQPSIMAADPSIIAAGRPYPSGSPPPYTLFPGAPEPATAHSDSITRGAHPWATSAQVTRNFPYVSAGPGPYRTPGHDYSFPSALGNHPNPVPIHAPGQEPHTPVNPQNASQAHGHASGSSNQASAGQQHAFRQQGHTSACPRHASGSQPHASASFQHASTYPRTPVTVTTGLPMGAGPEGLECHMPSWRNCSLRSPFNPHPTNPNIPFSSPFGHATLYSPNTDDEDSYEADDEFETTGGGRRDRAGRSGRRST
ncbi:hypothetical protein QBC43DRAFT_356063 [Cladorrhinum sp. PSN259]|nr:hypothetical protein QBC43DRAFT_356063 [Cladorrhinum sp. PSN259]